MFREIRLNGLTIPCPLALGPMAGVTDEPFRRLSREQGAGLFYTEMVSAKALYFHNRNTEVLLKTGEDEHPVGIQLFGSDEKIIASEAEKIEDRFDFIDLNFGCPVPKIVKNGEGSFLLSQPDNARRIFSELKKTVHKPVSLKIRLSFTGDMDEGLKTAKIAAEEGVDLIVVHGRTRAQFYSGKADWEAIRRIREEVPVPLIANGDVFSAEDALEILKVTGADGVMIARGAQGNPWIFREVRAALEGKPVPPRPDQDEIVEMILRHASLLIEEKGERTGVLEMRKHAAWYLKGVPHASRIRGQLNEADSIGMLAELLKTL
ncbi:MAG: tRNA dihydrouridine synthase DusB [Lachnospiraceae bacterium]|nr:tRNA dihydrouridine synthase DusB [Lachnospiraceae bacterium]